MLARLLFLWGLILINFPVSAQEEKKAYPYQEHIEIFNIQKAHFIGSFVFEKVGPNHHVLNLYDSRSDVGILLKTIFDDAKEPKFNKEIYLENTAHFAHRINFLISQYSADPACEATYRIIGFKTEIDYNISEQFGKCRMPPTPDKYDDGSMDLIFSDGKSPSKIHYSANGTLQESP